MTPNTSLGETGQIQPKGKIFDCAIVGGGPAGLSAAIYLGRLRRSAIVIDANEGRSTWHQVNRNYLGFPEGVHATELRQLGREHASRYGVAFLSTTALSARCEEDEQAHLFVISTAAGEVVSKTVILATGVTDRFPEFEGSADCLGRSIFSCVICDGFETIGKRVVVLGHDDRAAALALQLLVFTDNVTLVGWDAPLALSIDKRRALVERSIRTLDSGCSGFIADRGEIRSVHLRSGEQIPVDLLFVPSAAQPNNKLANELGVACDPDGYIVMDAEQLTNIGGAYAARDVTKLFNHQVTSAVHEGAMSAAAVNYYLYPSWQRD